MENKKKTIVLSIIAITTFMALLIGLLSHTLQLKEETRDQQI